LNDSIDYETWILENYQLYKIKHPIKISRKGAKTQLAKILFKTANYTNADF